MKTTIIEKRTVSGQYDLNCDQMIIDHPKHGRLLLAEGFGGMDSPAGGMYRWCHGIVVKLQVDDSFASLEAGEWNDYCNLYQAVIQGYDKSRPVLQWDGNMINSVVTSAV